MARPQKYGEKTVTIRVPESLVEKILTFIKMEMENENKAKNT